MRITITLFLSPNEPTPKWVKLLAAHIATEALQNPAAAKVVSK